MTSPFFNSLPSVNKIVSSIPTGSNPYTFGLKLLESSAFPSVAPKTFRILIFLSFIHACTILSSVMVIMLPFIRRHDRRKKLWLVKKFYMDGSPNIYWIPNTSLAVAVCQLLTSCFCEVYTYVDYASLKSPVFFAGSIGIGVCVQLMWLFNFYSYFATSWGALSTCLCSPHPSLVLGNVVLKRPVILYAICTIAPLLVTIAAIIWSIILGLAYHSVIKNVNNIRGMLLTSSEAWKAGSPPPSTEFFKILDSAAILLNATGKLITRLRWNSFFWAIIWTFTASVYTYSVWPLIQMIRSCSRRMAEMKTAGQLSEESKTRPVSHPILNHDGQQKEVGNVLRRSYIFLMCHCAVMTVSIIYAFSVCLVVGLHTDQVILMSQWRSLGAWLYLVGGAFSAVAMLSQTWRSYIDYDLASTVAVDHHPVNNKKGDVDQRKWNALLSNSSGVQSISDMIPEKNDEKTGDDDEVLVICVSKSVGGGKESTQEVLRE